MVALGALVLSTACEGKVLDVGAQSRSGQEAGDPEAESNPAATSDAPITGPEGIWVMTRQDGMAGVEWTQDAVPPIELEVTPDGKATRYRCVRTEPGIATAPCPATATTECFRGTIASESGHWRVSIPELYVGNVPTLGETLLLDDGTLYISYINPTFSGAYFKRIANPGTTAPGCAQ